MPRFDRRWISCLLTAALLVCRPVSGDGSTPEGRAAHARKVLMVVAPMNFRQEEYLETRKALEEAGYVCEVASTELEPSFSMDRSVRVVPDSTIRDALSRLDSCDAVVFVGGSGAKVLWTDPAALELAAEAYSRGRIVAAICIAPVILANAGLLRGRRFTCWPSVVPLVQRRGGVYAEGRGVVRCGRILTAAGPRYAALFGEALVAMLDARRAAEESSRPVPPTSR